MMEISKLLASPVFQHLEKNLLLKLYLISYSIRASEHHNRMLSELHEGFQKSETRLKNPCKTWRCEKDCHQSKRSTIFLVDIEIFKKIKPLYPPPSTEIIFSANLPLMLLEMKSSWACGCIIVACDGGARCANKIERSANRATICERRANVTTNQILSSFKLLSFLSYYIF